MSTHRFHVLLGCLTYLASSLKLQQGVRSSGSFLKTFSTQLVPNSRRHLVSRAAAENDQISGGGEDNPVYDLVVLGAGPVGVSAALASAELGKRVCLVDAPSYSGALLKGREDLSLGGPTGLFSKALRDTSKRLSVSTLRGMGISEESIWAEVRLVCEQLAAVNSRDRRRALHSAGVTYLQGLASFQQQQSSSSSSSLSSTSLQAPHLISVETSDGDSFNGGGTSKSSPSPSSPSSLKVVQGVNVLVATGSKAFRPPNAAIPFERARDRLFDSDTINGLQFLPKSIAITGSGIIAIE